MVRAVAGQAQGSAIKTDAHGNLLQSFRNMDVTSGPAGTPRSTANTGKGAQSSLLWFCAVQALHLVLLKACDIAATRLALNDVANLCNNKNDGLVNSSVFTLTVTVSPLIMHFFCMLVMQWLCTGNALDVEQALH